MKLNKKLTVLMPVYNGAIYLHESIKSILNQSYSTFDLLIINDCSTDNSEEVISLFKDERIKYIRNERNLGLVGTLNKGINLISSEYIARMDQDDICKNDRLLKQIEFMDRNREISICGSWINFFGEVDKEYVYKYPLINEEINVAMLFGSQLAHPSIIIRTEDLKKNNLLYDENYRNIEDYELWGRCIGKIKFANIGNILLNYRVLKNSMSNLADKNKTEKYIKQKEIYKTILNNLNLNLEDEFYMLHNKIVFGEKIKEIRELEMIEKWLLSILDKNREYSFFDKDILEKYISKYWFYTCYNSTKLGMNVFKKYYSNKISEKTKLDVSIKVKFLIKSLMKY